MNSSSSEIAIGVVILAAGASTRMGRPKMLLPWRTTSVIGHLITQWRSIRTRQIAVVCAIGDHAINQELDRIGVAAPERIVNPTPVSGMFSSIQCAARWTGWNPDVTHHAIVLGDQPHLRIETLRELVEFAAAHPERICQPSRNGRRRHPVVLPQRHFTRLRHCAEDNLKAFLSGLTDEMVLCEIDDPGLDLDLDRPEDYENALRLVKPDGPVLDPSRAANQRFQRDENSPNASVA